MTVSITDSEYYSTACAVIIADMEWTDRMEERRKLLGLTQERLSERVGITLGAYQHWLSGRRAPDKLSTFERIAGALECTTPWLLFGVETPTDPEVIRVLKIMQDLPEYKRHVLVRVANGLSEEGSDKKASGQN